MAPLTSGVPRSPAAFTAAIKRLRSGIVAPASVIMAGVGVLGGSLKRRAVTKLVAKISPPAIQANCGRADFSRGEIGRFD
jgi:hypothetical protein